jgi:hypothetical protein
MNSVDEPVNRLTSSYTDKDHSYTGL